MIEYFKKIYNDSANSFHSLVKSNLKDNKKMFIVTANPETLMIAESNQAFKSVLLDNCTTIIADGIGIVKGSKILNYDIQETIPGVELCSKLFEYCDELKKSIFLLGTKEEIVSKLVEVINSKYPNAVISGYENGYVEDKQSTFNKIASLKPDVVLVALRNSTTRIINI